MPERGDADLPKVLAAQPGQQVRVDVVVAEELLVLPQAQLT
jgi:hypothetical protein